MPLPGASTSCSPSSIALARTTSSSAVRRAILPISRRYIRTGSSMPSTSAESASSLLGGRLGELASRWCLELPGCRLLELLIVERGRSTGNDARGSVPSPSTTSTPMTTASAALWRVRDRRGRSSRRLGTASARDSRSQIAEKSGDADPELPTAPADAVVIGVEAVEGDGTEPRALVAGAPATLDDEGLGEPTDGGARDTHGWRTHRAGRRGARGARGRRCSAWTTRSGCTSGRSAGLPS